MRKVLIIFAALCFASLQAAKLEEKIQRSASEKLLLSDRPQKTNKGLFEKPTETETSEEEETEDDSWPWDMSELFEKTSETVPDFSEIQNSFSKIWKTVFGESGEEEEGEATKTEKGNSFMTQILSFAQPWWKGANICSREESVEEEVAEGEVFSSLMTVCEDSGSAYKCTMKIGSEGRRRVRTLIFECCHGFGRDIRERGCTKKLELRDMMTTLESMNMTRFVETAESIGLNAKFGEGNYTVFAPTNEALTSLTDSDEINFVVLELTDKMHFVRNILTAHLVSGWEYSHDWEDEMLLQTENEDAVIRINFYSHPRPFVTANCARLTGMDKKSTNGLIHSVDRVLMPARQNLWEILGQDASQFSIFTSLIGEKLEEKLQDPSTHFTVVAFTNEAFEKLDEDMQEKIRNKTGCFEDLISEMVFPHTICSAAIQGDVHARNLLGRLIKATNLDQKLMIGGNQVSVKDRIAKNGVLHVVDGVYLPDYVLDSVAVAEKNGGNLFVELLKENEDLASEVKPWPSVTLFVPPNEALLNFPVYSDEEAGRILKNHIVNDRVEVGLRNTETVIQTEAGEELLLKTRPAFGLSLRPFGPQAVIGNLGCARIIRANLHACGGLVHFVDRVLAIPTNTTMDVLKSKEELSEFATLMEMSGVELDEDFKGTLLAPTNTALSTYLSPEVKEALLADRAKFQAFIKQHILMEPTCCSSFGSGFWLEPTMHTTVQGNRLASMANGRLKQIGGAGVVSCDLESTQGLVHVVDRPIMRRRVSSLSQLFNSQRSLFDWP